MCVMCIHSYIFIYTYVHLNINFRRAAEVFGMSPPSPVLSVLVEKGGNRLMTMYFNVNQCKTMAELTTGHDLVCITWILAYDYGQPNKWLCDHVYIS